MNRNLFCTPTRLSFSSLLHILRTSEDQTVKRSGPNFLCAEQFENKFTGFKVNNRSSRFKKFLALYIRMSVLSERVKYVLSILSYFWKVHYTLSI